MLLVEMNAFPLIYHNLVVFIELVLGSSADETTGAAAISSLARDIISVQVDMLLDILWLMFVLGTEKDQFTEKLNEFLDQLGISSRNLISANSSPFFPLFLFKTLEKLADGNNSQIFSVRKMTLLLRKSIEILVGSSEGIALSKEAALEELQSFDFLPENSEIETPSLPINQPVKSDANIKMGLREYKDYRYLIENRYPCYYLSFPDLKGYQFLEPSPILKKVVL
jgi:hypothetical protein